MDAPSNAKTHYAKRLAESTASHANLVRKSQLVSIGRVVTFILGGGSLLSLGSGAPGVGIGVFLVSALAFAVLVIAHQSIEIARAVAERRVAYAKSASERMNAGFTSTEAWGSPEGWEEHPFAGDLDLLGKASLLDRIDSQRTALSRGRLTELLAHGAAPTELAARVSATKELASEHQLREDLHAHALGKGLEKTDVEAFLAHCEAQPEASAARPFSLLGIALPCLTLALAVLGPSLHLLPSRLWQLCFLLQYGLSLAATSRLRPARQLWLKGGSSMVGLAPLLGLFETSSWQSPLLNGLKAELNTEQGPSARQGMKLMHRVIGWLEASENAFFVLLVGPIFMADVHLRQAVAFFQSRYGKKARSWRDALAEWQALSAIATYHFENPEYCFAEVGAKDTPFEAKALAHPLLPKETRVANDVTIGAQGSALLITGSNMAGKSTLMRAMGLAVVCAHAGIPLPANMVRMPRVQLYSSMRISDSLAAGVSHFFAELLALKKVVDAAGQGEQVFFLLDEILHGTNSRERHLGARAVIISLLANRGLGAVSTHDLSLVDLTEHPGITPVHLAEQTSEGKMHFDYRLRPGVLRSGNALKLMASLGLPVEDAPPVQTSWTSSARLSGRV